MKRYIVRAGRLAIFLLLGSAAFSASVWAAGESRLELNTVDKDTGRPIAARMHVKDARGRPVKPPKAPFWKDHFVFDGTVVFELPLGMYTFELECGPEYPLNTGHFILERGGNDTKTIEMQRFVDLKKEGWWSGDLHIHRSPADIELLMRAEDLHIGPVITWWNNKNTWQGKPLPKEPLVKFDGDRFYRLLAGEDEREGGALLFFNQPQPLPITGSGREYPSPMKFVELARQTPGVHIDIEKPFWWDMPTWVALGAGDSIGLANNHAQRDGMLDNEAWGKPRDKALFPAPQGNGRWSQKIYYELLNCGLRIPPSAGSASGVLPNPVGYDRVYVHCDGELTWDAWWENLRKGQVFVTNGPLLRPRVYGPGAEQEGALPGFTFQAEKDKAVELKIALKLSKRDDPIDYLEIVQNGKTIHEVRLDQWAKAGGNLPPVKFDQSGWMLIRAVTNNPKTYRFASTGPYYVEIGYERRVSKSSAQFFLDWVMERARRLATSNKLTDPDQKREVLEYHRQARDFWQKKVTEATAD